MDDIKIGQEVYTIRHGKIITGTVVKRVDMEAIDSWVFTDSGRLESFSAYQKTIVTVQCGKSDRFERDSDAVFLTKEDLFKSIE